MFQLDDQRCHLDNTNARAEKHGESNVIGFDISFTADVSCDILDDFGRGLTNLFYKMPENTPQLVEEQAVVTPELRYEGVFRKLPFQKELAGYVADITWGDLASSLRIQLQDCKVHKFEMTLKQGGTCELKFQIQAHPDDVAMGRLDSLIQREVMVTLTPPQFEMTDEQPQEIEEVA